MRLEYYAFASLFKSPVDFQHQQIPLSGSKFSRKSHFGSSESYLHRGFVGEPGNLGQRIWAGKREDKGGPL